MRGSFGGSYGLGRNSFNGGGGGGDGMMRTVGSVMRTRINGGGIQDPFPNPSNTQTSPTKRSSSSSSSAKSRNNNNNNNNGTSTMHGLSISCNQGCNHNNINNYQAMPPCAWPSSGSASCPNMYVNDGCSSNDGDIDDDWEFMDQFYNDSLFGTVPSSHEVQNALFSLHQAFHPLPCNQFAGDEIHPEVDKDTSNQSGSTEKLQRTSSKGSELDWVEPSVQLYDQRLAQSAGLGRVYDAFHMLQTEPSVQKMVVSLSSDKAVWEAVLNNETVREIRDTYLNAQKCAVDEAKPLSTKDDSEPPNANSNVLKWIIDHMKGKLMEVFGNIAQFMGNLFNPLDPDKVEQSQAFSEKLQSTFMLTIVVLLIVVVSRGGRP